MMKGYELLWPATKWSLMQYGYRFKAIKIQTLKIFFVPIFGVSRYLLPTLKLRKFSPKHKKIQLKLKKEGTITPDPQGRILKGLWYGWGLISENFLWKERALNPIDLISGTRNNFETASAALIKRFCVHIFRFFWAWPIFVCRTSLERVSS